MHFRGPNYVAHTIYFFDHQHAVGGEFQWSRQRRYRQLGKEYVSAVAGGAAQKPGSNPADG
jgi:hypothetical protein